MARIWFTSDTHFSHRNIIKYCNRPFSSLDEMDESLVDNWNSVVKTGDEVWHLGDFAFAGSDRIVRFRKRLNGRINLILGNHDRLRNVRDVFDYVCSLKQIQIGRFCLILCHYPMATWNKARYGSIMLHGHCHGNFPGNSQRLDVGVDAWDFTPVCLEQIQERLKDLPAYWSKDHH